MKKILLVDGMGCLYDKSFNVDNVLLNLLNEFEVRKILVVNGFREEGKKALEGQGFEAFSLQEEGIKKNNPEYFKILLNKFNLTPQDCLYFDHLKESVDSASSIGIKSSFYESTERIKDFLLENLILKQ